MSGNRMRLGCALTAAVFLAGLCTATASAQSDRAQDVQRVKRATEVFQSAFEGQGSQIPKNILKTGQCVMIIPGYKTLALGLGGSYG
ncbi:MAG: hypothetical protein ACRD1F_04725, partial [Terriglobales bacterium]